MYASESNLSKEKVLEMMNKETLFSAEDQVKYGFAVSVRKKEKNEAVAEDFFDSYTKAHASTSGKFANLARVAALQQGAPANV